MKHGRSLGLCLTGLALVLGGPAALAQSAPVVSRPVVQALPSAASQRLNAALARIARDPRDINAMIEAGDAANALGDPEAALGFYRRAEQISGSDVRIKAGMARALVLQGDPVKAIPLFAAAEVNGARADLVADRGLAYDLVGDPVTAQRYYRAALAQDPSDEDARRRLGISLAIAGDAAGSEAMLMPLLRKQDKPAWRAHAFAMAIAGRTKEAVDTANAILPAPLAQSVGPYLRYMPRLTRAQQAAAANLGKFPRASEIGRDDPAIAAFTPAAPPPGSAMASADAALVPQGKPLGSGSRARSAMATADPARAERRTGTQRATTQRASRSSSRNAPERVAPPDPVPAISRSSNGELPPLRAGAASAATPAPAASALVASAPAASAPGAPSSTAGSTTGASAAASPAPAPVPATSTVQRPAETAAARQPAPIPSSSASPGSAASAPASAATQISARQDVASPASSAAGRAALTPTTPGFDLARMDTGRAPPAAPPAATPAATPAPAQGAAAAPASGAMEPPPAPARLEQIFADLGAPSIQAVPVAGAVDIRAIAPARPVVEPKPEPQPAAPPPVSAAEARKAAAKEAEAAKAPAARGTAAKGAKAAAATPCPPPAKGKATRGSTTAKGKAASADACEVVEETTKAGAKKAPAKKAAPSHPSRIWVQVGVGRDKGAIAFDWRRWAKQAPAAFKGRSPSITDMGRTNRILVGPFATQKAASDYLAQLKKAKFDDAFVWTSPAGQAVDALSAD